MYAKTYVAFMYVPALLFISCRIFYVHVLQRDICSTDVCVAEWCAHRQCAGWRGIHGEGGDRDVDALVLQDAGGEGQAV